MMHNNTRFCAYLFSVGTQHGNLLKSLVTTEQGDLFYSEAHTGNCVSQKLTQLKNRERIWTNEGEWTTKAEIRTRKKFLAGAKHAIF